MTLRSQRSMFHGSIFFTKGSQRGSTGAVGGSRCLHCAGIRKGGIFGRSGGGGGGTDISFADWDSWFDEFCVVFGENLGVEGCFVFLLRCGVGY
jgi:hypothetical protein